VQSPPEEAEVGGTGSGSGSGSGLGPPLLLATRWRCALTFLQLDSARNETSGNSTRSKNKKGRKTQTMGQSWVVQRQNANANGRGVLLGAEGRAEGRRWGEKE